ncbi:MAG: translation initiation factor IF-2 subunit gamma [Candidatus Woesearchaeota archaeon]
MVKSEQPVQPVINIGTIGHVDHGKTTLVQALTGKWADTHSEEIKRGITIRLGYADAVFRKCPKCDGSKAYTTQETCPEHKVKTEVLRKVSFVDAPGHESLMATMLSGARIMDYAILLVAANEECPQPQTREHLVALQISGIDKIIVVQNKIDIVDENQALKSYAQIKEFLKGTKFENAPVIPISAQHLINIDVLIEAIEKEFPTPQRDPTKEPQMLVARTFDINKPGEDPLKMKGGVFGGILVQGQLTSGQEIEIKPGVKVEKEGKTFFEPLTTKIVSIITGGCVVKNVTPGGNLGVQTLLDPSIVKSDQLAGSVVGNIGKLPPVWYNLKLEVHLLDRVVGSKEDLKVEPIKKGEILLLNINSCSTAGIVMDLAKKVVECKLKRPVCADLSSRVTISRRVASRFRLIGYGIIQ